MKKPLWRGPEHDGVSFSLLSRFLSCRERFRVYVVEGLKPIDEFSKSIEFGNMWHGCEEAHAAGKDWDTHLYKMSKKLLKQYPTQQEEVEKWYRVCKLQFPIYLDFYDRDKYVVLEQEQVFKTPYKLPSGRTVYLKGKRDKVFLVRKSKQKGVWLQEHKTKGEVDEEALTRQVTYDLQTMIYRISLQYLWDNQICVPNSDWWRENQHQSPKICNYPIRGVQYNVIRRPLSGGKGSIKQKKGSKNVRPETTKEYYNRVAKYIRDEPETYFFRWDIEVTEEDITRFKKECLDPILENLCDWYSEVTKGYVPASFNDQPYQTPMHWRHPFGCRNFIDENGYQDVDHYLDTGDKTGLVRVETLFPELEDV